MMEVYTQEHIERIQVKVAKTVATLHGVSVDHMKLNCRKPDVIQPRQEACYVMFIMRLRQKEIASYFSLERSTVAHSVDKIARRAMSNTVYLKKINRLIEKCAKI